MTPYNNIFDTSIQCEESMEVTPEEYAEVMQMMAEEHAAFEGAAQWSASLEEKAPVEDGKDWLNGYRNIIEGDTYEGMDV